MRTTGRRPTTHHHACAWPGRAALKNRAGHPPSLLNSPWLASLRLLGGMRFARRSEKSTRNAMILTNSTAERPGREARAQGRLDETFDDDRAFHVVNRESGLTVRGKFLGEFQSGGECGEFPGFAGVGF